jgi:protease-4
MPSFLVTPVSSSTELREEVVQRGSGVFPSKIVIIEVEGMLLNTRSGGLLQPQENDVSLFAQQLDRAEHDPAVRAIVLRVNSPGGTVSASDSMYQTLLKFKERCHKPVVASTQDVSASGAYYVSCAADKIVAQPTSIVGSIGVIFNSFDVSETMSKIGVRSEAIKSGPLKDMGSPFKPLGQPERAVMQGMVDEFYARFKAIVKSNRHLDDATLTAVSDGRVFTGSRAVEVHLVDQLGYLPDAIELAKQLANAPGAETLLYKRPYGYGGSIYANSSPTTPQANVIQFNLSPAQAFLPTGFYYLWQPK